MSKILFMIDLFQMCSIVTLKGGSLELHSLIWHLQLASRKLARPLPALKDLVLEEQVSFSLP